MAAKSVSVPRSTLALSKLCSKNKKDVQRASVFVDDGTLVCTNGVVLGAAEMPGVEGSPNIKAHQDISILASDLGGVLKQTKAEALSIRPLDDTEVEIQTTDVAGTATHTLRQSRTDLKGWQGEFKGLTSIAQLCLSIDDMIELLRTMKAAAGLKGNISGQGFGVFIDVCQAQDSPGLRLLARIRNVQHNGSVAGIMRALSVGDRWLTLSDWDKALLEWEDE